MAKIQAGISDPDNTFNLGGLDYPKNRYEIYYSNKVLTSDGSLDESVIKVGVRSINNSGNGSLQSPLLVEDWVNGSDLPYSSLTHLVGDLISFVGFNTPQEGGVISDSTNWSGWAQYGDSTYTSTNTLSVASGSASIITIDGLGATIKSQLPVGVTDFFDIATNKITPVNSGDGYTMSLSFQGITNNNNGDATIYIDIGGTFNRLFPHSFRFSRGTGVAHEYYFTFCFYTLDTFLANGGSLYIESGTGVTQIYDILLQIHKTHNSR